MWNSSDFGGKRWHVWRDVCGELMFLLAENASLKMELVHGITATPWRPSLRRTYSSSVRSGFVPVPALRPSSARVLRPCPLFCPFSGDRSILGYAVGLVVITAPRGAGLNPEKEAGGPRRTATDGPPHRASTRRPDPAALDFAAASCFKPSHTMREQSCLQFLFKRVGPCHLPQPHLSDLVSLSVWPALADALCQHARPGSDLFG